MIPPSIVLIFFGLITETSIHALFQASFLPGFIMAGFYIIYILIRTNLNPALAPLPEPSPDDLTAAEKFKFGTRLLVIVAFIASALIGLRAFVVQNFVNIEEHTWFQSPTWFPVMAIIALATGLYLLKVVGWGETRDAWNKGKGLLQPLAIVFIVLGSIYGGITGITEAAAIGSIAVLMLIKLRGEFSMQLVKEASMRTFK
ncbi:MAG: TRAP transporter large permease subunit, partial [Rhodobacteraceae bacterium]|nr:TRAP transporter large permease subunit [Paracoccaceae bacterium]